MAWWTFREPPRPAWVYRTQIRPTPAPEVSSNSPAPNHEDTPEKVEAKWMKIFHAVFDSLRKFPEAKEAALCALEKFKEAPS